MYFFMCSSSERTMNYATKMARMLLSSTYEGQRSVGPGKAVWTVATSPGSVHSSRNCRLEECSPPENVDTAQPE